MAANQVKERGLVWPKVLRLLIKNDKADEARKSGRRGLTVREMVDKLDLDPVMVYRALARLKNQGLAHDHPAAWHRSYKESTHHRKVWFVGMEEDL